MEAQALDRIVVGAARGLMLATLEERLKARGEHQTELTTLTKQVRTQAEAAASSAKAIRMEGMNTVLSISADSLNATKEFRGVLEKGRDDTIAANLERLLKAMGDLRSSVEGKV